MKRFEVYKNIRKRAVIFGLPISLFAIMMIVIIASLLVIIFSFGLAIILGVLVFNGALYLGLSKFANAPHLLQFSKVFPNSISNKKSSAIYYEEN